MNSKMEDLIADARQAWKEGNTGKALERLDDPTLKENEEALFLMGEIHYNMQNWGKALNCFRRCLQIKPDFEAAQTYVELILNILGFFHTDHFNP
jgi:tetratricopeptide (TPR) repeat protein